MTERLTEGAAGLLERRTSRRGVLARAAVAASALAVAPLRYVMRKAGDDDAAETRHGGRMRRSGIGAMGKVSP